MGKAPQSGHPGVYHWETFASLNLPAVGYQLRGLSRVYSATPGTPTRTNLSLLPRASGIREPVVNVSSEDNGAPGAIYKVFISVSSGQRPIAAGDELRTVVVEREMREIEKSEKCVKPGMEKKGDN